MVPLKRKQSYGLGNVCAFKDKQNKSLKKWPRPFAQLLSNTIMEWYAKVQLFIVLALAKFAEYELGVKGIKASLTVNGEKTPLLETAKTLAKMGSRN